MEQTWVSRPQELSPACQCVASSSGDAAGEAGGLVLGGCSRGRVLGHGEGDEGVVSLGWQGWLGVLVQSGRWEHPAQAGYGGPAPCAACGLSLARA